MSKNNLLAKFDILFFYVAPILLLSSTIARSTDDIENIKAGTTGGILLCFVMICFVFVLDRLCIYTSRYVPKASAILRILFILGCFVGFCFGLDSVLLELTNNEYTFWTIKGVQIFAFMGIIWPLALISSGIVFLINKIFPSYLAFLVILCGVMFPAGRIPGIEILWYLADLTFILTFWLLARHLLKNNLE